MGGGANILKGGDIPRVFAPPAFEGGGESPLGKSYDNGMGK
jgi:hypothetical protein